MAHTIPLAHYSEISRGAALYRARDPGCPLLGHGEYSMVCLLTSADTPVGLGEEGDRRSGQFLGSHDTP